jgi:Zn-dependent protease with chaperone function
MKFLQWPFWIIGLTLQYLVTQALLSGPFRQFSVIFGYLLCLTITTVTDILMYLDVGSLAKAYSRYYWTADLLRESALYAVVISLVLHAMPDSRRRAALLRLLVALALLFWIGSVLIYQEPSLNKWMIKVVRNLSFCSAVATLILWLVLIASEKRDTRLLVITGGLGLQMTGEAMGQSLIQISKHTFELGVLTLMFAHFLCLYIWWRAFRTPQEAEVSPQT